MARNTENNSDSNWYKWLREVLDLPPEPREWLVRFLGALAVVLALVILLLKVV